MRTIETCRSCESNRLKDVLSLGTQNTSDFREDDSQTSAYPIEAVLCEDCMLVQLRHTTPSNEMYHENYGFKSGISDSIKDDLQEIVGRGLRYRPTNWLDIASNDGTLLSYVPKDMFRVGVDPIGFLCQEAEEHADLIINDFFVWDRIKVKYNLPLFDMITSISCFYDMDDPNQFVSDVKKVLSEDGVWIIQQNYLLTTLELGAVDNFCHEHLEYYTLLSLEPLLARHGLEVFRVETNMVNGGSLRTYVGFMGKHEIDKSVVQTRTREKNYGLDDVQVYKDFATRANNQILKLHTLVRDLYEDGKTIAVLAASTRGATIWQAARLEPCISYAVERNPAKVGRYFSAIGVPIISEEEARMRKPDYMIIGPWFFASEIIDREVDYLNAGGVLIVPLPEVQEIRR